MKDKAITKTACALAMLALVIIAFMSVPSLSSNYGAGAPQVLVANAYSPATGSTTTVTKTVTCVETDTVTHEVTTTVTATSVNTVTNTETVTSVVTTTIEGTVTQVSTVTSTKVLTTTEVSTLVSTLTKTVTETVDPPQQTQQTVTNYVTVTSTVDKQSTLVIETNQTMPLQPNGVVIFPITLSYGADTLNVYGAAIPIYTVTQYDTLSYTGYYLSSTPIPLTCQGTVSVNATLVGQKLSGSASCPTGSESIDLVLH